MRQLNIFPGLCRFGDVSNGCALPCTCQGECDKVTGECQGQCPDGPPTGYRWRGPGCTIGTILYLQYTRNTVVVVWMSL